MSWLTDHKVLPDKQPDRITVLVEDICLVDASCPDADHVLVALDHQVKPSLVPIGGDAGAIADET